MPAEESPQDDNSSWFVDDFTNYLSTKQIRRKVINSAIYVERPLSVSVSSENTSICQKYSNEDFADLMMLKTKRCTCTTDPQSCACHKTMSDKPIKSEQIRSQPVIGSPESRPRIIRSCLSSGVSSEDKDVAMRSWLARKEEEKRAKILREKKLKDALEKQKHALAEQEEKNFQLWLENKRKAEIEAKKKKEKERQMLEFEKERKQVESKLSFLLWLKKKEEAKIEKRIKEHMKVIDEIEEKKKKMERNEQAFKEWVKISKDRPKPVPFNQGLRSWSASSSSTWFNPVPWKSAA